MTYKTNRQIDREFDKKFLGPFTGKLGDVTAGDIKEFIHYVRYKDRLVAKKSSPL